MRNSSRTGFSLSVLDLLDDQNCDSLNKLCSNADITQFCRGRLQAGTGDASKCSPEGERYNARPKTITTQARGRRDGTS